MRRLSLALLVALGWAGPLWAQGPQPAQSYQAGASMECTFSTTAVVAVCTRDAIDYRSVSVHVVTQGGSSTVTFQGSNDGTNWVSHSLTRTDNVANTAPATSTTTASIIYSGILQTRYFRLNVTGIASGTTAGVVEFFAQPAVPTQPTVVLSSGSLTSVVPGTAATALGKAEDAGHTTGDTGVFALGVRNESTTQITSADLDYSPLSVDAYGDQFVRMDHQNRINCSADNIAATLTELTGCSAPGAGSIYIQTVVAQSTTATGGQFLLRQGTGTNCGTGTASVFPSSATAARWSAPANTGSPFAVTLVPPIKLTALNALCVLGVATNTTTITATGFIAP